MLTVLFLGMVYVALFLNTVHILRTQIFLHKPSHEHGRGDVTLLDVAFWALVAASFIAQQKVSNALCIDSMIGWTTVIYIALMFVLCQPGELAPAAQAVVAATWLLHFVCMLVMSGMHLLTGLAFVHAPLVRGRCVRAPHGAADDPRQVCQYSILGRGFYAKLSLHVVCELCDLCAYTASRARAARPFRVLILASTLRERVY